MGSPYPYATPTVGSHNSCLQPHRVHLCLGLSDSCTGRFVSRRPLSAFARVLSQYVDHAYLSNAACLPDEQRSAYEIQ